MGYIRFSTKILAFVLTSQPQCFPSICFLDCLHSSGFFYYLLHICVALWSVAWLTFLHVLLCVHFISSQFLFVAQCSPCDVWGLALMCAWY